MTDKSRHKVLLVTAIIFSGPGSVASIAYGMHVGTDQKSTSRPVAPKYYNVKSATNSRQEAPANALRQIAFTETDTRFVEKDTSRSGRSRSHEGATEVAAVDSNVNSMVLVGLGIALMSIVRRMRRL